MAGGLKQIFSGMSKIVGMAEQNLASKINGIAKGEMASDGTEASNNATGLGDVGAGRGTDTGAAGADGADAGAGELSTEQLLALQYDVQRFSIFNNMATSTMQTVAGAYQSVTGNLNFR